MRQFSVPINRVKNLHHGIHIYTYLVSYKKHKRGGFTSSESLYSSKVPSPDKFVPEISKLVRLGKLDTRLASVVSGHSNMPYVWLA